VRCSIVPASPAAVTELRLNRSENGKAPLPGPLRTSGACRDRTGDLRLAKPALSQLS
jgi:hypothetical protein